MIYGSVCSGIEAASVAWHPLGWRAAWLAEIEPFPSAVLAHHYPAVPNLGDMTTIAAKVMAGDVVAPDVLVGGTPCQAFSVAGLRAGLSDPRGELTLKYVELANAIDAIRRKRAEPESIIVWENVPGVLSSKDNAFGCFLAGLAGESEPLIPTGKRWPDAGCVFGSQRAIAWRVLDAQYFGLAQRRRRVFLIASARAGFNPASVLFEFDGMRRDTAPRREAGQETAGTLASRTGAGGFPGTGEACSGYVQPVACPSLDVAICGALAAGFGKLGAPEVDAYTAIPWPSARVMTVHGSQDPCFPEHLAFTLGRNNGAENAVCVTGDITHTLKAEGFDASEDGTGRGQPIINALRARLAFVQNTRDEVRLMGGDDQIVGALAAEAGAKQQCYIADSAVRRLTPRECERLQGFPDDYTAIQWRGKNAADCPDGPRYKALGNSKAVPVVRWIGRRIAEQLK